jgi:hypothetical protein
MTRPAPKQVSLPPGVGAGLLIRRVSPVYPDRGAPRAHSAHIQGTVLLPAQISKEGTIANLPLIRASRVGTGRNQKPFTNGATALT